MRKYRHLQSRMWSISSSGNCSIALKKSACEKDGVARKVFPRVENLLILILALLWAESGCCASRTTRPMLVTGEVDKGM
jgi:hypothetical protein